MILTFNKQMHIFFLEQMVVLLISSLRAIFKHNNHILHGELPLQPSRILRKHKPQTILWSLRVHLCCLLKARERFLLHSWDHHLDTVRQVLLLCCIMYHLAIPVSSRKHLLAAMVMCISNQIWTSRVTSLLSLLLLVILKFKAACFIRALRSVLTLEPQCRQFNKPVEIHKTHSIRALYPELARLEAYCTLIHH